jgi:hypothetical protein
MSALVPSCAPTLPLSAPPSPLVSRPQPSAHDLPAVDAPTISPPWTRPRSHVLRPRPCARAPFEPRALLAHPSSLICALCPTLSPSLAVPTRTGSSATARRRPLLVPGPPLHPCLVQRHGELRLSVSCSGHPSVYPFLPCCVRSTLTGAFLA